MYNCPSCNKPCEWKNEAFLCDDCKIVFFGIENIQRFTNYVNNTLKRADDTIANIKAYDPLFLHDLMQEYINSKDQMTKERVELYDTFFKNQSLKSEIQIEINRRGASYPSDSELLHKLYVFECSTQETEQIAIDLERDRRV